MGKPKKSGTGPISHTSLKARAPVLPIAINKLSQLLVALLGVTAFAGDQHLFKIAAPADNAHAPQQCLYACASPSQSPKAGHQRALHPLYNSGVERKFASMDSSLHRDQQHHGPVQLFSKCRVTGHLLGGGRPFLNLPDTEAGMDQGIERGADSAMVFQHALGEPIGLPRAFGRVAIQRPGSATIAGGRPIRLGRRHVDRMLDRKHALRASAARWSPWATCAWAIRYSILPACVYNYFFATVDTIEVHYDRENIEFQG